MDDAFGELRSLLNTKADAREAAWPALTELLESNYKADPARTLESWIPYASKELEGWPDEVRVAPRKWIDACLREQGKSVLMALCRTFDTTRSHQRPRFRKVCKADGLEAITHFVWGDGTFTLEHADALRHATAFPNLRAITFTGGKLLTRSSKALGKAPFFSSLTSISISNVLMQPAALGMFSTGEASSLKSLDVTKVELTYGGAINWQALVHADLPSLEHLSIEGAWYLSEGLEDLLGASYVGELESLHMGRASAPLSKYERLYGALGDAFSKESMLRRLRVSGRLLDAGMHPDVVTDAIKSI